MSTPWRLTGGAIIVAGVVTATSALAAGPTLGVARVDTTALRAQIPYHPVDTPIERAEYDLLEIVNELRQQRGMAPLFRNDAVALAAGRHAADMAAQQQMSHYGSDGSDAGARLAAAGFRGTTWSENIGSGFHEPADIVQAWMDSPGHRATLLGDYLYGGVGLAFGDDGIGYWSLLVAG